MCSGNSIGMRGTVRKITMPRRLVADLMHASVRVPFVSLARPLNIRGLVEARGHLQRPPGRPATFSKAFAPRQRANYFGSFGVTSVAAFGPGELYALGPGPFVLSYGVVNPDQTVDVVLRWDHRITDAALMTRALARLEQVLNGEIAGELRANRQQSEPKAVRAVAT